MKTRTIYYRQVADEALKRKVLDRAYADHPRQSKREVLSHLLRGDYRISLNAETGELEGIRDSILLRGVFGLPKQPDHPLHSGLRDWFGSE